MYLQSSQELLKRLKNFCGTPKKKRMAHPILIIAIKQCDLYKQICCYFPSPSPEPLTKCDNKAVLWQKEHIFLHNSLLWVCKNGRITENVHVIEKETPCNSKLKVVMTDRMLERILNYLTAFQTHASDDSFISKLDIFWWKSNRVRRNCASELICFSSAYLWHHALVLHLLFAPDKF